MTKELPLVLIGGGGHAGVLLDLFQLLNRPVLGIVDPGLTAGSVTATGVKVLGGDEAVGGFARDEVLLINGLGSTGSMAQRDAVYRRFSADGFRFGSAVHPSAIVSRSTVLAEGVQIMAGAVIQNGVSLGANSIVNTRASVDHDCRIGETVHIAPGVTLSGAVTIGNGVHVGVGAVVIQRITIGSNSLIGAGATVHRDLPEGSRYMQKSRDCDVER